MPQKSDEHSQAAFGDDKACVAEFNAIPVAGKDQIEAALAIASSDPARAAEVLDKLESILRGRFGALASRVLALRGRMVPRAERASLLALPPAASAPQSAAPQATVSSPPAQPPSTAVATAPAADASGAASRRPEFAALPSPDREIVEQTVMGLEQAPSKKEAAAYLRDVASKQPPEYAVARLVLETIASGLENDAVGALQEAYEALSDDDRKFVDATIQASQGAPSVDDALSYLESVAVEGDARNMTALATCVRAYATTVRTTLPARAA